MESLFESLLTLIPIALIIALRIAAARKERQGLQDKTRIADVLKANTTKLAKVVHVKQEYKPAFRFEETGHPPIAVWEDASQKQKSVNPSVINVVEQGSLLNVEISPMKETTSVTPVIQKTGKMEYSFPLKRLRNLSQLQQAVVYAELLGPPKGLQL
ncbi:hypothetical protein [Gracilinema caldarium]|uniref:Uncharacterized protein n=1 Tax=Gracilinema caldarium (strain ATCC 51460 / DSM 7334 / H1) TaxID=744872 RepID=F8EX05_GRAC1|nr:hypothetical protein [Gracilinema caldarium]AEJ18532.1 hypothetical protein Spica_0368 [Gracilinema caldarium DSM 7334]